MVPDTNPDPRNERSRLLLWALFVSGLVVVLHFTPLKHWLDEAQSLKAKIDGYGWRAHVCFIFASALGIAMGVPRLALCGLGGMLFGFVEGFLVSQFAGVLGAYGAFLLTRFLGPREWVRQKLSKSDKLRAILGKPTVATIFVARQLPVPGMVPNVLLGVLETGHLTFLLGTFLGYLPSNIPVALFGSSMGKESLGKAISQVSLSMLAIGLFSAFVIWMRRRFNNKQAS